MPEHPWLFVETGDPNGSRMGPVGQGELIREIRSGRLTPQSLVSSPTQSGGKWYRISQVSALARLCNAEGASPNGRPLDATADSTARTMTTSRLTQFDAYEIFLSYSRKDNQPNGADPNPRSAIPNPQSIGWVTALRDRILADHRRFSTEPLRIFFDVCPEDGIKVMDDWRHRILGGLRSSKILLVCLSPNYFRSDYCRWEWVEYLRRQVHQLMGHESIAPVYFVEVPGCRTDTLVRQPSMDGQECPSYSDEQQNAAEFAKWVKSITPWLTDVTRSQATDISPWFPSGVRALQEEEVRKRMAKLGESLWQRIQRARRADGVPGNLRRQNPHFVGRREELRRLHEQLGVGTVGVVTAVHGLGGQGKTELAVAYAHGFADCYPAGLWVLGAEGKKELLPLIGELAYTPELNFTPTEAQKNDPVLLGRAVLVELQRRAQSSPHAPREESRPAQDPSTSMDVPAHDNVDPVLGHPHAEREGYNAAALLILDNVSESALLSTAQLGTLPRADWLRIVATTRLGEESLRASQKSLALVAVDSLAEEDALALVRDHQPDQQFVSPEDEAAARGIVRELGGFTLAVEQVAVYLGLHPSVTPRALLASLRDKGLIRTDELARKLRHEGREGEILHQQQQLGLILDATLALLSSPHAPREESRESRDVDRAPEAHPGSPPQSAPGFPHAEREGYFPALTALQFAALLPPDTVPWPWLRALTTARHPELSQFEPDEPDPWLEIRRRLEGLRLLTSGDQPEIARIHRLVAAHLLEGQRSGNITAQGNALGSGPQHEWSPEGADRIARIHRYVGTRAFAVDADPRVPDEWELNALLIAIPVFLAGDSLNEQIAGGAINLSDKVRSYRSLAEAASLINTAAAVYQRLADTDPANAEWQRDLSVSFDRLGDLTTAQGNLPEAQRLFGESLRIRQRLAESDPANAAWQRDLSVSHYKLAMFAQQSADDAGCEAELRECYLILHRMKQLQQHLDPPVEKLYQQLAGLFGG